MHAPGNRPVSDELAQRVQKKVPSFGTHILCAEATDPVVTSVQQQFFGDYEPFDLEWQMLEA